MSTFNSAQTFHAPKLLNLRMGPRWIAPVILLYVVGGAIQYIGILSLLQTNAVVLLFFSQIFIFWSSYRQLKWELPIFVFMLFTIIIQLANSVSLEGTLTYIFYLITTLISAVAGRQYSSAIYRYWTTNRFFRVVKLFLILNLCVVASQSIFAQTFVKFSHLDIGLEDAVFGTFYVKSDAVLAAVCELLIVLVYSLPSKAIDKFSVTVLAVAVVFIAHSNAARATILLVVPVMILRQILMKVKIGKYVGKVMAFFILCLFLAITYYVVTKYIDAAIYYVQDDYYHVGKWDTDPRFAPLGEISIFGFDWVGHGPLTYYNPITKEWLFNSGFSTLYSLYIDYGAIGFGLFAIYGAILILKFASGNLQRLAFSLILASYCIVNFALSDVGFLFCFNFALMAAQQARIHSSQTRSVRTLK